MFIQHFIGLTACLVIVSTAPVTVSVPTPTKKAGFNHTNLPIIKAPRKINYETLNGGYEGDMIFPPGFDPKRFNEDRALGIAGPHAWPGNVIPYDLSAIGSQDDRDFIENAMQTLMYAVGTPVQGSNQRQTCVYFRPRTEDDTDYFRVVYGSGCSGTVGYTPYMDHVLTLAQPGCFYSGIVQHELLHILGFYHEQSRPDRDRYITVNYQNIEDVDIYNFDRYQWGSEVLNQNAPYDYGSIMHYDPYAFSKNGLPTIVPKRRVAIGQRDGLSQIDIAEVRVYYGC